MGFSGGSMVKNASAMQETWVQSLGQEVLLPENFTNRGIWWDTVHGLTESDMTEQLTLLLLLRRFSRVLLCATP